MITGPTDTVKRARKLRSEMSLPERLVWRELRQRPGGLKFRRQHPVGIYILDFYCPAARLAIEIDGRAHDGAAAAQTDAARTEFLKSQHIATTRIPARAVLDDAAAVTERLVEICSDRVAKISRSPERVVPLHHPADGSPPRAGEDRS